MGGSGHIILDEIQSEEVSTKLKKKMKSTEGVPFALTAFMNLLPQKKMLAKVIEKLQKLRTLKEGIHILLSDNLLNCVDALQVFHLP